MVVSITYLLVIIWCRFSFSVQSFLFSMLRSGVRYGLTHDVDPGAVVRMAERSKAPDSSASLSSNAGPVISGPQ